METALLDSLKQLLELGWPAIVTVAAYLLARQYMATVDSEIAYLRAQVSQLEAELIKVKQQLLDNRLIGNS